MECQVEWECLDFAASHGRFSERNTFICLFYIFVFFFEVGFLYAVLAVPDFSL